MKRVVGSPGTWSGMALRVSQCVFAAASVLAMVSAYGFANYSAYFYMNFSSMLQLIRSLALACLDIFSLRNKKDLHAPDSVLLIVLVDWAMSILMFSGACAAASLTIFFMKDKDICAGYSPLGCNLFALSVTVVSITWSLQAASSGYLSPSSSDLITTRFESPSRRANCPSAG